MKIYIASPYSHVDARVRETRFRQAACYAGILMAQGHIVFSPIAHSHPIVASYSGTPNSLESWMIQDLPFIDWCDELHQLKLDGWMESEGCRREREHADANEKPVRMIDPPEAVEKVAVVESILEEALRITGGDRQRDYDSPLPNHQRIAKLWNAYLSIRKDPTALISPQDVIMLMIQLKMARLAHRMIRDGLTDIAGYARCIARIEGFEP